MAIVFTPYLRNAAERASRIVPIPDGPEDEPATGDTAEATDPEETGLRPSPRTAALAAVTGVGGFLAGRWLVRRWRGDGPAETAK